MKKMSFKCIFNRLCAKTLNRAMSDRQPREDREMKTSLYRLVCVSYVSRTMLVSLFLLVLGGWNTQAWGECTLISDGSGSKNTKSANETVYSCSFTNSDNDAATISYTCTIGAVAVLNYGSNVKVQGYYNDKWNDIATLAYGKDNQNKTRSHTLTGDAMKLTQVRFVTTSSTKLKYGYSVSNFKVVRASSLKLSQSSHDLGNVNIDSTSYKDFTVTTYNLSGTASTSISGDGAFSRTLTANSGDCPKTWTLRVSYNPTCSNTSVLEQKKCTVTVSLGGKTASVIVKATPQLVSQSVNWQEGRTTTIVEGESMNIEGYATSTSTIDGKRAIYYTSSAPDVISVGADGHTLTAKGTAKQSAIITAHQDDDCKFASATATQTFTITKKLEPNIVLKVDGKVSDLTTLNLKVGDKVYVELENVSDGLDGDFTAAMTKSEVVSVTRLGNTLTIEALKEDATTVTLKQTANSTIAGASKTYTINVTRIENTLALNKSADTKYIDQEVTDVLKDASINSNAAIKTISSDATIAYYNVEADKIVIKNSDKKSFTSETITIKIWQEQNVKYAASDEKIFTLTVNKYPTSFTGSAYNLMVDGTQTADYGYTNTSAAQPTASSSDDFYYTIDEVNFANAGLNNGTNLVTFNPSDKKITACNAGTAKITLHQKETYKYTGATASYNVAVYKYNSVFDKVANLDVKVDGNVSSAYTLTYTKPDGAYIGADNHAAGTPVLGASESAFYYTLTQGVQTSVTTGSDQPTWAIAYDAANKKATGKNAGKGTVHLYQPETYKYNAADASFDVNVTKYANSISCSWESWSKDLNFDEGTYVNFPTTNTNYSLTPIVVNQTSGNANATYYPNQGAIYASYNVGSATWSVYQPEDYKYLATDTNTLTVNIGTIESECYVFGPTEEKNWGTYGEVTYDFSAKGTRVYYDVKRTAIWGVSDNLAWHVLYSVDGEHWTSKDISVEDRDKWYTQWFDISEDVRHVKFESTFGAGGNHFVRNVRVVRKEWFNIVDENGATISSTISMPTNTLGENKTTKKIYIDYSTCAETIKLVSSHQHITFGDTKSQTYQFTGEGTGKQEITLTYASDSVESIEGDVTIYTPYEHETIHIKASTQQKGQTIEWHTPFDAAQVTLPVTFQSQNITPAPATATSGLGVKYSVNAGEESVVRIENDGASFTIIGEGTAHLTASQAGNTTWSPASDTKVIISSNKLIQRIYWNQVFTRGMSKGAEIPLAATVHVENVAEQTNVESPERTALLQYTCADNSVAEVVLRDGVYYLKIKGYGSTTITASVPGNETYEPASPVIKEVVLKEIVAGDCEAPLVLYQPEEIEFFSWLSLTSEMKSYQIAIDRTKGIPDKLSFDVRGEAKKVAIEYYRGGINVQESTDNCASWSENLNASLISPEKGKTISSGQLQLSPNATHIRFVRPEGAAGYHYMGNIQVTMLPALEAPAEIDFGNIACGENREDTKVQLNYSYVKGSLYISKQADPNNVLDIASSIETACGDYDSYELPVHITPDNVGPWENTITITDGSLQKEVKLKATFTPGAQDITWKPKSEVTPIDAPLLNAFASSGLEVGYEIISGASVAKIQDGKVVILQPGTFAIKVTQPGNTNYTAAEPVTKTFTVSAIPLILTAPTASSINASQTLNESALTGGTAKDGDGNEVAGTWAWQNSSATYSAGEHTPTVVFTPSTNPAWYSNTTTTTALTVTGVEYIFTNGHGDSEWDETSNWAGGNKPSGNDKDVIIRGNLTIDDTVVVKSLTIEENYNVTLTVGGQLTVGDGDSQNRTKYGDLHVLKGGQVVLNEGKLKVNNFILDASLNGLDAEAQVQAAASGQVTNPGNIDQQGNAYFDLSFDPSGKISYGWYDFTVPFEVNISGGISRINSATDKVMVCGTDFLIMEDDEANYVAGGKGWHQIYGGVLQPGKLYTITFDDEVNQNTFRFTWNGHGSLENGSSFNAEYHVSSDETRTGWNALGNGMLQHGYLNSGLKVQTYDHTRNTYNVLNQHSTFAIGTAFFVQVPSAQKLNWTVAEATNDRPLYAPQREAREVEEFRITLGADEMHLSDVLYFSASEETTDAYAIGHDLVKRGTPQEAKDAQMWATKGGKNLCDIEATLYNNSASTPLSLYAPQNGQYTLTVDEAPEDANLYLTYNGSVIWDLTASPYSLDLTKGTTEGYGLQLEVINAPQITTGVDEINGEKEGNRKVLINNAMYIITKEGAIFNATGKKVK